MDVKLPAGENFNLAITKDHNSFVYPYEGTLAIGPAANRRILASHSAGVLSDDDRNEILAEEHAAAFLLLAGRPIGEPIAQYGPFVMNTREEIEQAMADYRNGQLV